jgi:ABC-2 type transport system ATP-binding protein
MNAVTVNNISKSFGAIKAVNNLTFQVEQGDLFGFIGPDGGGKTTLIRMMNTLIIPDEGSATVNGLDTIKDYKKIRLQIGYMPGRFSLYQDLTVEENLNFFATVFGTTIKQNYDLIRDIYVQIEPFKDRRAGKLSGGMKQKLALCCALIHKPEVLFLDEPTTGVDAVSRKEFWEMLKRLKQKGITILVSTPYLDEASLCDKVALMQSGNILEINTPENIVKKFEKPLLAMKSKNMYKLITALRSYKFTNSAYPFGEYLHYTDTRETYSVEGIKNYLMQMGVTDAEIIPALPNIEDTFMQLMEKGND